MSDWQEKYASADRDGHTVPLIGVPKEAQLEQCDLCGDDIPMREAQINGAQILCAKCNAPAQSENQTAPAALTPDFQDGPITLYLGDCAEIMPRLIDIDAVVTDPPYGIKRDAGMGGGGFGLGNKKRNPRTYDGGWDSERPAPETFKAMLKTTPQQIIWGGNYFADLLPVNGKWLIWDKQQTMPSYSDAEMAWTSLTGTSVKMFRYSGNGLLAVEKDRVHPTQKPVALMQWCLGFLPGAKLVLDPFMGSGTTGIACIRQGMRFIGIERDEKIFKLAVQRIKAELDQGVIPFAKPEEPVAQQQNMFA